MDRFDHDTAAVGIELVHDRVGDLARQALLDLWPPRVAFDQAGELAQSDYPTLRDVADVRPARERQEVMLAGRGKRDVAQNDHLPVVLVECHPEMSFWVFVQSREEFGEGPATRPVFRSNPSRSGIFADCQQDLAHRPLDPLAGRTPVAPRSHSDPVIVIQSALDHHGSHPPHPGSIL